MDSKFKTGNFNDWETLIYTILPVKTQLIRNVVLPRIEQTIGNMVNGTHHLKRESIDITQNCKDTLESFTCDIVYNVDSFEVPDAPKEAVESDRNSISTVFQDIEGGISLEELEIDVATGNVHFKFEIPIKEEA